MSNIYKTLPVFLFVFAFNCGKNRPLQIAGETMGTTYQITIINHSNNEIDAIHLQEKVDSLLNDVNNIFSTYIKTSELTRFNDNMSTMPTKISTKFSELYQKAVSISLSSDGSFDFTVLSLVKLWGFGPGFNNSKIPSKDQINEIMHYTGIENVEFSDGYLSKLDKHVQIDFSAIAKGWGVDQVALFLNDQGFNNYMVEIGGEIRVSGFNNFNSEWSLGISSPEDSETGLYTTITVSDLAVATSGSYNNYFTLENTNYSHIINPKTGYPIKHDLVSATIVAKDCATADAIATAVMVKGFNLGLEWINSLPDIECLLVKVDDSGNYITGKSSGFNY
ncbi:MAG: FAD:protein FMN transferase [Candidatus Marinimicrobia bacterium]|nr:FAD:protein FMN transferase [Candidatus Neomarinimicrobiota bacterium]